VKTVSDKTVKAFIGLTNRVTMITVGRRLLRENLAEAHPPPCETPIFNLFSLVSPQP